MQEQIRVLSQQVAARPMGVQSPAPPLSSLASSGSSSSSSSDGAPSQSLVASKQEQIRRLTDQLTSIATVAPSQLGYTIPPPQPAQTDPVLLQLLSRMESSILLSEQARRAEAIAREQPQTDMGTAFAIGAQVGFAVGLDAGSHNLEARWFSADAIRWMRRRECGRGYPPFSEH